MNLTSFKPFSGKYFLKIEFKNPTELGLVHPLSARGVDMWAMGPTRQPPQQGNSVTETV